LKKAGPRNKATTRLGEILPSLVIVDSNDERRDLYGDCLNNLGFEVICASDALAAAFMIAKAYDPDLVGTEILGSKVREHARHKAPLPDLQYGASEGQFPAKPAKLWRDRLLEKTAKFYTGGARRTRGIQSVEGDNVELLFAKLCAEGRSNLRSTPARFIDPWGLARQRNPQPRCEKKCCSADWVHYGIRIRRWR
jgi:hypothetical protein